MKKHILYILNLALISMPNAYSSNYTRGQTLINRHRARNTFTLISGLPLVRHQDDIHNIAAIGTAEELRNYLLTNPRQDINLPSSNGETALHFAARSNNIDNAQILIEEYSANVNARDLEGQTALHIAVKKDNTELIRLLLRNNANPNIKTNTTSETPICIATALNKLEIVKLLVEYNADVYITNNTGKTPFEIAKKRNNSIELINFLKTASYNQNISNLFNTQIKKY